MEDIVDVSFDLLQPLVMFIRSSPIAINNKILVIQKTSPPDDLGAMEVLAYPG